MAYHKSQFYSTFSRLSLAPRVAEYYDQPEVTGKTQIEKIFRLEFPPSRFTDRFFIFKWKITTSILGMG